MADTAAFTDDRMEMILAAAKRAFSEKGFDGASMQDLARAAGMSAGNFYRYFPSKDAIVQAMVERDLADFRADFEQILNAADPLEAAFSAFQHRMIEVNCQDGPLWSEIDAAAARRPEIAQIVGAMEDEVCRFLCEIFARISNRPAAEASDAFQAKAVFLMMLFKGAVARLSGRGCPMTAGARDALRSLVFSTAKQTLSQFGSEPA